MLRCLAATAPRLHVRDDRDTSLFMRRDTRQDAFDLPDAPSGIFFARRLDEWNRIERICKIGFYARRILRIARRAIACREEENRSGCLTGKSAR
jgi:hypothetical protein